MEELEDLICGSPCCRLSLSRRELPQAHTSDEDSVGANVALTLGLDVSDAVLLGAVVLVTLLVGEVLALAETEALAVMEALRVTLAERVAVAVRLAGDGVTVCTGGEAWRKRRSNKRAHVIYRCCHTPMQRAHIAAGSCRECVGRPRACVREAGHALCVPSHSPPQPSCCHHKPAQLCMSAHRGGCARRHPLQKEGRVVAAGGEGTRAAARSPRARVHESDAQVTP